MNDRSVAFDMAEMRKLLDLVGVDALVPLIAQIEADLDLFHARLSGDAIDDNVEARRYFHKLLGFATQFFFSGLHGPGAASPRG
jgi:hypothetical protein